jgi:N-acetylmuramoyl-L-alanine amidase
MCHRLAVHANMPCVGIVVIAGALSFVVAPDPGPSTEQRLAQHLHALPTIVLDPGHGGRDEGARAHGLVEKELALDVAERTERLLQSYGFSVVLTRRDNTTTVSLEQRAALANAHPYSLFVSLHFDQTEYASASGVAAFYAKRKMNSDDAWTWVGFFDAPAQDCPEDEALAGYLQTAMIDRTEANNRGIKARDLYVVRNVRAPAVLVEGGFLSNAFDAQLLGTPEYRDRLAASLVAGILEYQKGQPGGADPAQLASTSR